MRLYGIWQELENDWLRELPSQLYDGGEALLVYDNLEKAQQRAASNFGFDDYHEAHAAGWVTVKPLYN